jgi:hypothetical protein
LFLNKSVNFFIDDILQDRLEEKEKKKEKYT